MLVMIPGLCNEFHTINHADLSSTLIHHIQKLIFDTSSVIKGRDKFWSSPYHDNTNSELFTSEWGGGLELLSIIVLWSPLDYSIFLMLLTAWRMAVVLAWSPHTASWWWKRTPWSPGPSTYTPPSSVPSPARFPFCVDL